MKGFLTNLKKLLYVILFGIPLTIWLLFRNRRTVYFIPTIGLGDYCISLGYLKSFREMHGIEHITLIIPPNRAEVAELFPYWDSILSLNNVFYLSLIYIGAAPIIRKIYRKLERIRNINYGSMMLRRNFFDNPSTHVDTIVRSILDLPDNIEREGPTVSEIDIKKNVRLHNLIKGKTILLNPYTSGKAVKEIDTNFYIKLARELKEKGFGVVTILSSEMQNPVFGTEGIVTSLSEAWCLASWCGYVVGTRSGFFDFICFSGCNIIAIYESSYRMKDFFSLKFERNVSKIKEFVWEKDDENQLTENICVLCMKWEGVEK